MIWMNFIIWALIILCVLYIIQGLIKIVRTIRVSERKRPSRETVLRVLKYDRSQRNWAVNKLYGKM